ncbi:MAG: UvrD-helicase domain-containing protein [Dehalococcoidia bacterium]|nr:UvrD-helicase domain-containing protein [Dehalococcoidia bacterium]
MTEKFPAVDQVHRSRIEESLDENLFVEAGAGTGKTTALVSRVVALIASGRATIDRIAAITFTEAAAAELRDRVRQGLEDKASGPACPGDESRRCAEASRGMDGAAIQTLHSFAGALLRERPIEAGLPPVFETVEEIEAGLRFEEEWQRWLDEALERNDLAPIFLRALMLGLGLDSLRRVAEAFHANYDLLTAPFEMGEEPRREIAGSVVRETPEIQRLVEFADNGSADPLAAHASRIASLGERLRDMGAETDAALALLSRWGKLSFSKGRASDWRTDPQSGRNACTALKDLLKQLEDQRSQELGEARRAALTPLLERVRLFVRDYFEERRRSGVAEFHDLLVWARDLLRDNREARRHFQQRFTHILIDEFQDTDPIQAEIAFFLSSQDADETDWRRLRLLPGKLFVVGDPKQSIYRFRRADIAALEEVRVRLGAGGSVPLTQNFRSQEPILSWCNAVFSQWMRDGDTAVQASYIPLEARWRPGPETAPNGVYWMGGPSEGRAAQRTRQEARAIAAVLANVKAARWQVRADDAGAVRAAQYQDICILLPARTMLRELERALDLAGIPYRVESQSLVLGTQDVRELLNCLRAIDSPADQVALVAALRSSAFGCSDVELLDFVEAGGRLDYLNPGTTSGPIAEALEALHKYHQERLWRPPDELIEEFVRERAMVEVCFARPRPRERWRRLRFVIERARAFASVRGSSLRAFLDWIERQAQEKARLVEAPVPETDEDAVRIMTVHASKGLEFPIVIMAGLGSEGGASSDPVIFHRAGGSVEVRIGPAKGTVFSTRGYEEAKAWEESAAEAEGVRLMYVAATRARDHLVVCLFHSPKKTGESKSKAAIIQRLASQAGALWREADLTGTVIAAEVNAQQVDADDRDDTLLDRELWQARRAALIEVASRPAAWGVTGLVHVDKDEAEGGDVPHRRGRGGTNVGRAVHSVLQTVDLATGAGLEDISRAQASAEGIPDRWRQVARLARAGIESAVVRRAVASGGYHREVFVSARIEDTLLEGFIDLLFEDGGELVIADYKTDSLDGEDARRSALDRYGLQAGLYALAVEQVTGKPVREAVLVFVHTGEEMRFGDIPALTARAREKAASVVAAGRR